MTEKIECQYCNEKFSKRGLPTHEKYCDENPKNKEQLSNQPPKSTSKNQNPQKNEGKILPRHLNALKDVLERNKVREKVIERLIQHGKRNGQINPSELQRYLKELPSGIKNDLTITMISEEYEEELSLSNINSYHKNQKGQGFQPSLPSKEPSLIEQAEVLEKLDTLTRNNKDGEEVKDLRNEVNDLKKELREEKMDKKFQALQQQIENLKTQETLGRSKYDLIAQSINSLDSTVKKAMNARMEFLGLTPQKRAEKRPSQQEQAEDKVDVIEFIEDEEMIEE